MCTACKRKVPYALVAVSVAARQSTAQLALRAGNLDRGAPLWTHGFVAPPGEKTILETAYKRNQLRKAFQNNKDTMAQACVQTLDPGLGSNRLTYALPTTASALCSQIQQQNR